MRVRVNCVGVSGNILIHSSGNRLNSYDVLDYEEGQDAFDVAVVVDLTQRRHKVDAHSNNLRV